MTQLAAHDSQLQELLDAADARPGADANALTLTLQAAVAAAEVSPELARPYVGRLWFTPWRVSGGAAADEREARWTARMTRTTYEVDGEVFSALELGEGPTVLLLHGWGDHAARVSAFAEPLAAEGLRVIAPDLPGHGRNEPRETSLPEWARAVEVLTRSSGARAVVAHSLGGVAASRVAVDADLDVLVLVAPAVRIDHVVDTFRDMFGLSDAAINGLRQDIESRFGTTVWEEWQVDRFRLPGSLPVLLMHSSDDDQIDVADGRMLAAAIPSCEFVELTGLGHTKALRDGQVIDRVVRFVSERAKR